MIWGYRHDLGNLQITNGTWLRHVKKNTAWDLFQDHKLIGA